MIPDPGTVKIIHDHMVETELARQHPERERQPTERYPNHSPRHVLREAIAGAIYRIAARIDPHPRANTPVAPTKPAA
ncbi:MAG TPA: hypothetical protein VD789_11925 [Thermomicrobiales bacterium]|nr:hypothetical protein [Thermomicrobiales bacterium]